MMTILYLLIPLSLAIVGVALWLFFWAVSDGQFEDLDSPGVRIIADDPENPESD